MAPVRDLAPLLVFFLLINTAPAARTVTDTVQEVCGKTQFPKICVERLTPIAESQKASPRRLAELFVNLAAEAGSGMAAFVNGKFTGATKDDAVFKCYDSCSDEVEEAVAHLNGLVREPTDGKFLELKSWLSSTLGGTSACEDACRDAPATADKDAVLKYSVDVEKMLRITLDLIAEASGSMSGGIALPPTGAEAPFAGYGSAAEAPGPEAMSAFPEGDGAASSSSEGAEAPSLGSAEGPTPTNAFKEAPKVEAPGPSVASEETTEGPAPSVAASGDESSHAAEEPAADDGASDADATA
ncbi:hypothetical protein PR202_ga27854 [Eleusine coracana subsp. coracana]|uniref:Pectinesterase inhibitor domain-containing protein n=1 Tax=Eleusine coracana subsp. coracana TaxID=191504 RepID=A0AAV5DHK6_ELECO|nr:hypothetical protein QOZ80_7AG0561850 [Eleusine coracana subsp. coracana]GJN09814.1 hypothetical protein PR202_ga27854 [Eleusine coracana subsp. coracana]